MRAQSHRPDSEPPPSIGFPSDPPSGATAQGRHKKRENGRAQGESGRHSKTIGMLPYNVLLEIFDFYRKNDDHTSHGVWKWHLLLHVCRTWRQIIFESPHRLNLRLLCTRGTPVRDNLDIWPAFPIVIEHGYPGSDITPDDEDNLIAALEHPDRVDCLDVALTGPQLETMAPVLQEPFPVLTRLNIYSNDGNAPNLPANFLGGFAPCLQKIFLYAIPFQALPKLLLSTGDLVGLTLHKIPPTGYVSPEAMVASLAALPSLETFAITFQSPASRPDRIRLPPVTRIALPALTSFIFKGASEYLEDLVTQIDSPQLNQIYIEYLNQLVDFQVAQLSKFIHRSVGLKSTLFGHARVTFFGHQVSFDMYRSSHLPPDWRPATARTIIGCEGIDWQAPHIAQVLSHFSTTLSNVVHLKLGAKGHRLKGADDVEWLHLLHQFSTVQRLCVSWDLAGHVALALEGIAGETVAEVLPSLDLICLAGQPASSITKFITARRLSGRPVTVVDTEAEFDERLESYVSEE